MPRGLEIIKHPCSRPLLKPRRASFLPSLSCCIPHQTVSHSLAHSHTHVCMCVQVPSRASCSRKLSTLVHLLALAKEHLRSPPPQYFSKTGTTSERQAIKKLWAGKTQFQYNVIDGACIFSCLSPSSVTQIICNLIFTHPHKTPACSRANYFPYTLLLNITFHMVGL